MRANTHFCGGSAYSVPQEQAGCPVNIPRTDSNKNGTVLFFSPIRNMPPAIGDWATSKSAHTRVRHVNSHRTTRREHTHDIVLGRRLSLVPGVVSVVAHIEV